MKTLIQKNKTEQNTIAQWILRANLNVLGTEEYPFGSEKI